MSTTNNDGKDYGKVKLGVIEYDDGRKVPLTWDDVKELLRKSYDLEKGPEAAGKMTIDELRAFKNCLQVIVDFDIEGVEDYEKVAPGDHKRKARMHEIFRNALQTIIYYLDYLDEQVLEENPQDKSNIAKFLRGELEYMFAPRPRGYNELLKINSTGERGLQHREVENKIKISFQNRASREEQIIRQACELTFLDKNFYGAKNNLLTRVWVPVDEIMEILGRPNNPENKKKFKQQLSPRKSDKEGILNNIKNTYLEIKMPKRKGEGSGDWIRINIGQACGIVNDQIYFQFSENYARYINTGIVKPYHEKLMRLGSRQFPLPYYVGQKLWDQYFYYANQSRGTNNILQVRTLLNHCKETIAYEWILETDPTHWKSKIKAKYERALNEIQENGLFKWQYCGPGLKEITQAEVDAADFYKWSDLYITFQLIPKEPAEQAQRLENRRKRIEAAKEKKAQDDDKTTVEADRIRKRRRKKAAEKQNKGK